MAERRNPPVLRRTPLADAIAALDALPCAVVEQETVQLEGCVGRVTATGITPRQLPDADARTLADGYALAGLETVGASPYNPLPFRLLGSAAPAKPYPGSLVPGTAVRIAMGAAMPPGADAVLLTEGAQERGDSIDVFDATGPGAWTETGSRWPPDPESQLLPAKHRLRAFDLPLLAAHGVRELAVQRLPRVRILVMATQAAPSAAGASAATPAVDATGPMLRALIERDGGIVADCIELAGDVAALAEHLAQPGTDLTLTVGGTGMGFNDHTVAIVRDAGPLLFHGVNLRPGESVAAASLPLGPVVLLPGHPVAAAAAYECLAARLVRRLAGRAPDWPHPARRVRLARKVSSALGVTDWCRVRLTDPETAEPLPLSGPPSLAQLAQADGFFLIPPESEGHPPGSIVDIHTYA
jgi:molybdopterin molybdotransferase